MKYPEINSLSDTLLLEGEVWKPVLGWEGLYSVSNMGRVRREVREVVHSNQATSFRMRYPAKVLKAHCDSRGYPQVALNGKRFKKKRRVARVHRLVAEAFLPNPEDKPQVNHMNSDVLDARVDNLEWCTASENQLHAYHHGGKTPMIGGGNGNSKYDEDLIKKIYLSAKSREESQEKIGQRYGVPQITVSNILTKKTWSHITDLLDAEVH